MYGTLNIGVLGQEQVIITGAKDDLAGGDTNADGTLTTPSSGDWREIAFNPNSRGNIVNTVIRYGGSSPRNPSTGGNFFFPLIDNRGGVLLLDNVVLSNGNNAGLETTSGSTTFINSTSADLHEGVRVYGGRITIGGNTFANIGDYAIAVYNATDFTNNGGNTGGRGIYMNESIGGMQTWGKDTLPYIANAVGIRSGSTLTIAPGAVVKVLAGTYPFYVEGSLTIGCPRCRARTPYLRV